MVDAETTIRSYIAKNILFTGNGYPHDDQASFLNEGIISSVNILELVMFTEECFGIQVDDADLVPDNFDSVQKLASYIRRKLLSPA